MKIRRVFWTLILLACLITASVSVAAREHKDDAADNKGRGKGPSHESAERPREPGKIVQANVSTFQGRYVGFSFDSQKCELSNYTLYNLTVIASIQLTSPCDAKGGRGSDHGSSIQLGSSDNHVRVHDAPNGLLHLRASEGSIKMRPVAEANLSDEADQVSLSLGNLTGFLRAESESDTAEAWNITGKARFWIHPLSGNSPERKEIQQAIQTRKVAGEVDILLDNGTISSEILTYEDVVLRAQRTQNGSFRFLVDGNLTQGRTFVVNLGPGLFEQEKIGLRYWDLDETSQATEVPILEADSLEDVLEILPDEGPKYWITQDKDGKHVLVAVPHFSVHVFEVMGASVEIVPMIIWGAVAGAAFVAMGAAGLRRRRSPY